MDFTRLDAFLDRLTSWRVPGNDCIVIKDGAVIYRHISGYADLEAMREMKGDETYNMWSCSKPVTCAAALTLLEKGDILLEDDITDYLPEFADIKVKRNLGDGKYELAAPSRMIKIRDLFTMTSGYSFDVDKQVMVDVTKNTNGKCPTREILKAFAQIPLEADVGERWFYGISHDILAGLVEVVAGERFRDYVKRVIFDPLGMKDSMYGEPTVEIASRMARQYNYDDIGDRHIPSDNKVGFVFGSEYDSGGAGLISTVEDCGKFAYAMANGGVGLNGNRILSRRTIDLMRTPALTPEQRKTMNWYWQRGYNYGLGVRTMAEPTLGGSNGPKGEFGWAGAAGAYMMIDPDNNLGVFYAEHMLNSQEPYIVNRIRNIVYSCLDD